ncbi:Arc family DNA-binding protein [Agrobacterium sp. 33MFTa1.1]|uniref:Arc family DNA-binding protein n=1 Tax=Agrobacterium TaxID=357 RepID=UPI0005550792|nr:MULTISPECIES: Arc family DNA-binding protein [Agrobacterium]AUC08907.1 hypothetical protein BLX90_00995 [Rhizobium sp. Y9]MCJ2873932.1 Arc family DNA-binding protein [Agrobacterium pusense]QBJ12106.1 Arc family DNA-binding protein [Agrobacterium sp. 33MFTa1.1]WMW55786.1 Arc family DNA-binding protein [Agrobacterium pusense]
MTEENRTLDDKFALRLPKTLKAQIAKQAKLNNRSTNAEMVARLEASLVPDFTKPAGWEIVELREEIIALKARVVALEKRP